MVRDQGLNKWSSYFIDDIFKCHILLNIPISSILKCVHRRRINIKSALVAAKACHHRTGNATFPGTIVTKFNGAYTYMCKYQACRPHFYQTRSAWSKDQGSNENHSPVHNFAPTVTKFCVMWEGQALPQDTKFGNCRDKIVDSRAFLSWSLILGLSWSGLIKLGPGLI